LTTNPLTYKKEPNSGDLDILVLPKSEDAKDILEALEEFVFGSLDLKLTDFTTPDKVVQLGASPVRVDIATSITGVSWEEAAAGWVKGSFGDISVSYLGRKEFIQNKRTLGRKKDMADLEALGEE